MKEMTGNRLFTSHSVETEVEIEIVSSDTTKMVI